MVQEIKSANEFEQYICEDKITLVDFFATWCGPCRTIAPAIEEFAATYKDIIFIKVNVDNHNDLCSKHEITSMPTFAFFKSGKRLKDLDVIGARKQQLEESIKKALTSC